MTVDFDELPLADTAPTPASEESLRALVARLTRERNHFQDRELQHLKKTHEQEQRIHELEQQLIAARAAGEVM